MKDVKLGRPYPLGWSEQIENGKCGINFSLFSATATKVELCLFDKNGKETRIEMAGKTEDIWHCWVANIEDGIKYGYRVYGDDPYSFNPNKLMLDPYATVVEGKPDLSSGESRAWFELSDSRDNAMVAPKAVICRENFDWENDRPLQTPWSETIIYELHVKGFTRLRDDLPKQLRGTYAALAHPTIITYLKELGITAVELLPINYHIDEPHLQERRLHNYWGYNSLAMFAVEPEYWSKQMGSTPISEFKAMVKALHAAGIEVILDVVFNHTAESEKTFPTFSQRGIDDRTYYWQTEDGHYLNWTGCGNMLNLSHKMTRAWVIDCLRYWVEECHVDGFRFDLGAVLGRETPAYNPQALLFKEIAQIPSLQRCKLIAEPWDIGEGGYQVGNFPPFFAEWNDRFRDDVTKFWLWQSGELGALAERVAGSSDIYKRDERLPHNSVNFISAHDGFTLRDAVSYNQKHNFANGEDNRDGRNENYSYNHGFEGSEFVSNEIECGRFFSSSALLKTLLLSNGTPMLLAGDEFGNSQFGNNNAYCQDNEISWLKWRAFNDELFYITKQTIALRKRIKSLQKDQWWTEKNVRWLNANGQPMAIADWHNNQTKAMQILLDEQWLLLINAKTGLQTFLLPTGQWEFVEKAARNGSRAVLIERSVEINDLTFCVLQKIRK